MLHELQVLRKAKRSSVTRIALDLFLWVGERGGAGWDAEGVGSVDIMPRGQTITSDLHIQTLKTLADACYRDFDLTHVAVTPQQQDKAEPHRILKTKAVITKFTRAVLPHPPYSPYHAPTHFHLFGALKEAIHGKSFGGDEVTEEVVASTKFQVVLKGHICSCYSLVKGCWH